MLQLGERERKKSLRRERIIEAARSIFRECGFNDATTVEIARRARIGTGTLFRHAGDKHELLLMVLHDELEAVTTAGIAALKRPGPLVTRLLRLYRPRFDYWASDLVLARSASAQVFASHAPNDKPQYARVNAREARVLDALAELLATYGAKKPAQVARSVHYLYIGVLRTWMNEEQPTVARGVANLRIHFEHLVDGERLAARRPVKG